MSQCVPSWDLDDNPNPPKLSAHSNSISLAADVPMLEYEVAELTWENGQLAMHGLGPPRVSNKPHATSSPTKYTWDKQRAGETLEAIVNQATLLPHRKIGAEVRGDELVPWLNHPSVAGVSASNSATLTMDALVPCAGNARKGEHLAHVMHSGKITCTVGCSTRVESCSGDPTFEDRRQRVARVPHEWSNRDRSVSGSATYGMDSRQEGVGIGPKPDRPHKDRTGPKTKIHQNMRLQTGLKKVGLDRGPDRTEKTQKTKFKSVFFVQDRPDRTEDRKSQKTQIEDRTDMSNGQSGFRWSGRSRPENSHPYRQVILDKCDRELGVQGFTSTSMGSPGDSSSGKQKSTTGNEHDSVCHSIPPREAGDVEDKKKGRGKSSVSTKRSRAAAIHNQSERKRRDKINQRMKTLQKLVPNSSKTDKASMLDEVIEYLKQLQAQVQMISRMNMSPLMLPLAMQQQLQMSMMNPMGMGMGMGMGVMDLNNIGRSNIAGISPVIHPSAFMPLAPWEGHAGDRLPTPSPLPDPLSAFLACQSQAQPMTMDAYSRMASLFQQQMHQPPGPPRTN